ADLLADGRERPGGPDQASGEAIALRKRWVEAGADRGQASRVEFLPFLAPRDDRGDLRRQRLHVFGSDAGGTGADLDLFAYREPALQERAAEDPSLQCRGTRPRTIDVERAGHIHERRLLRVPRDR